MQPDQPEDNMEQSSEPNEPTEMYTPNPADSGTEPANDTQTQTAETSPSKPVVEVEPVHWSASEYIESKKSGLWFVVFAIVVTAFIATDILFIKSYTFSVLVVVMAVAIIIYSRRPPRTIDYTLSGDQGLYIGEKLYHFSAFKAFGLISDQGQHSIMLIPVKRFSPGVSVYFSEEAGEKIVDILGARLPMQELKLDMIDIIVRKLRL